MKLTILLSFIGNLEAIGVAIIALIGFIIGWKFSNFFIPPRDYWTKSGLAMFSAKLGIAVTGACVAVWGVAALITAIFS
ncbi:hypothetical protein [Flavobacterium aciduliphilum]|uniref:Immunity protein 17 of polymorphic toxin system n=1 Tax=Flavobacterium aciduliphilum TaxID=1101402 RepID=A0A328YLR1_9FLAO|nr:hypothetical protein [Flavobacterium aciduliphilum]RAR73765.1 hypothetical protein CLV55_10384 [Flavobacterium aciduliphilum]